MQRLTATGLEPAKASERRSTIMPILNGNSSLAESLVMMWGQRNPKQAHETLGKEDVTVTNQSDKDNQLPKILELDARVRSVLGKRASTAASLLARTASAWHVSMASVSARVSARASVVPAELNVGVELNVGAEAASPALMAASSSVPAELATALQRRSGVFAAEAATAAAVITATGLPRELIDVLMQALLGATAEETATVAPAALPEAAALLSAPPDASRAALRYSQV